MKTHSAKTSGIKKVPRPAFIDANQRYTMAEVHAALGQSHTKTFQDIKRGKLATVKDGRRRYVIGSELIRRCGA
jgi:hypothetical protein